jgi:chemotaxis protein MotB
MRKRNDKDTEIIVKRRKKSNREEFHGGAWKVAFADFTMAMMALFMVLWVITPQNIKQTTAADQVVNPLVDGGAGIFDGNSKTPLEMSGMPVQLNKTQPQQQGRDIISGERTHNDATLDKRTPAANDQPMKYSNPADLKELAALMQTMAVELDAQANIEVQLVPQGLRILIKDDQERFMFERGSVQLNPHFAKLLERLAEVLAKVGNKLIISGHTDSVPYRAALGYNNWNLSGDRALRARNVMVDSGLAPSAVLQVAAQADVMPLRPEAPEDGANRRIEILLLTVKAESLYRELFGEQQARVDFSGEKAELVMPAGSPTKPALL